MPNNTTEDQQVKVEHIRRPKAWIPFANFALVPEMPQSLRLQDHLFPYEGMDLDPAYIWGVYGTISANQGLFIVDAYARQNGLMPLTIQGWYRVDNFDQVRSQVDREVAVSSGFVHMDRLKMQFRDELHHILLSYAQKHINGFNSQAMTNLTVGELLLQYPVLVKAVFEHFPSINMVVHPVRQIYLPNEKRTFSVATMRLLPERVMSLSVRFLEDRVKVSY